LVATLAAGPGLPPRPARAQVQDVEVAMRGQTIEALPFLLARAIGAEREAGLRIVVREADNPIADLRGTADVAVGTGLDRLLTRAEAEHLFTFYRRAPAALVVRRELAGSGLGRLSLFTAGKDTLAHRLAFAQLPWEGNVATAANPAWFGPLSTFRLGYVDAILGLAPLPQYLAAEGGTLVWDGSADPGTPDVAAGGLYVKQVVDPETRSRLVQALSAGVEALQSRRAEDLVAVLADQYPAWEPDALYAAIQVAQRALNPDGRLRPEWMQAAAALLGRAPGPGELEALGAG
jgi:hypothetical protein